MKETLSDEEKFCLDAYLLNHNRELSYRLSRKHGKLSTSNPKSLAEMISRWFGNKPVKDYLQIRQSQLNRQQAEQGEIADTSNRNRDDIVSELNRLADSVSDAKSKTAILLRLADLEGMKKNPTSEENNEQKHITYYMPLQCTFCELYKAFQTYYKKHGRPTFEDEWNVLMSIADKQARIALDKEVKEQREKEWEKQ